MKASLEPRLTCSKIAGQGYLVQTFHNDPSKLHSLEKECRSPFAADLYVELGHELRMPITVDAATGVKDCRFVPPLLRSEEVR